MPNQVKKWYLSKTIWAAAIQVGLGIGTAIETDATAAGIILALFGGAQVILRALTTEGIVR